MIIVVAVAVAVIVVAAILAMVMRGVVVGRVVVGGSVVVAMIVRHWEAVGLGNKWRFVSPFTGSAACGFYEGELRTQRADVGVLEGVCRGSAKALVNDWLVWC